MLTYKQITECVRSKTGRTVKTCWIAEVKREMGLTARRAWNSGLGVGAPRCPSDLKQAIRRCLIADGWRVDYRRSGVTNGERRRTYICVVHHAWHCLMASLETCWFIDVK